MLRNQLIFIIIISIVELFLVIMMCLEYKWALYLLIVLLIFFSKIKIIIEILRYNEKKKRNEKVLDMVEPFLKERVREKFSKK